MSNRHALNLDPEPAGGQRADRANFASIPRLAGVEVLSASFLSHRFSPHSHDSWAIGAVSHGAQNNAARRGVQQIVAAGELTAIAPGEVHAGRSVGDGRCEYAMVYVPEELLRQHAADLEIAHFEPGATALADPGLARRLSSFVALASRVGVAELALHGEWCALLDGIVLRYANRELRGRPLSVTHVGLRRANSYLHQHWAEPISLRRLAAEASMSPSHFCRQFTSAFGLSPHRYQVVLRVTRAKDLLCRGEPIANVAALTGFSDQSHLGRQLKGCLGVTPGELGKQSQSARTF